jgi:hypothetical protein
MVHLHDPSNLDELLAEDVVLHSPVVHTLIEGKKTVSLYLHAAFHTFLNDSFHYTREIASDNHYALEFEAEIEGLYVNGVDMISFNDEGKITDFKVMIRPLKALNLIHHKMEKCWIN